MTGPELLSLFISAFVTLFVVIDPPGCAPIFAGLTSGASSVQARAMAVRACLIATGILFAFTARGFGKRRLWISLPAGILFSLAIWLLFTQVLRLALPAGPLERLFV